MVRVFSTPLSLLLLLVLQYNFGGACCSSLYPANPVNTNEIKKVVNEAVAYNGWVNEPDFREKLALLYAGDLLGEIVDSVEQFRSQSTDWHTLTFIPNCHIVYSDDNTAMVLAGLLETGPEGSVTGEGIGTFTLHNTKDGWRITNMNIVQLLPE